MGVENQKEAFKNAEKTSFFEKCRVAELKKIELNP